MHLESAGRDLRDVEHLVDEMAEIVADAAMRSTGGTCRGERSP